MRAAGFETLTLSTESCAICKKCAYPDAPCRHPDKMFPCVESYGILVTNMAEQCGIEFIEGGNVVVWFSLVLLRERPQSSSVRLPQASQSAQSKVASGWPGWSREMRY